MMTTAYRERAKKLRKIDLISVIILTATLLGHALFLPFGNTDSDTITAVMLFMFIAVILHGGYIVRQCFQTMPKDDRGVTDSHQGHFFTGLRFSFFTPLIAVVILLPWVLSGTFDTDSMTGIASLPLLLLLFAVSLLLSPVVALLVIAPLELIIRGFVGIATGDRSKVGYLSIGGIVGLFTTFAVIMGLSIRTNTVYPASIVPGFSAIFGIPGTYDIINEGLLWVGRVLGIILIVGLIVFMRRGNKKPLENKGLL